MTPAQKKAGWAVAAFAGLAILFGLLFISFDGDSGSASAIVNIPDGAWKRTGPNTGQEAFEPLEITVAVGTTVTWTNNDITNHTVTSGMSDGDAVSPDGVFNSGFFVPGETFSYTFTEAGEFPYYCLPHPWMIGKVTVTP